MDGVPSIDTYIWCLLAHTMLFAIAAFIDYDTALCLNGFNCALIIVYYYWYRCTALSTTYKPYGVYNVAAFSILVAALLWVAVFPFIAQNLFINEPISMCINPIFRQMWNIGPVFCIIPGLTGFYQRMCTLIVQLDTLYKKTAFQAVVVCCLVILIAYSSRMTYEYESEWFKCKIDNESFNGEGQLEYPCFTGSKIPAQSPRAAVTVLITCMLLTCGRMTPTTVICMLLHSRNELVELRVHTPITSMVVACVAFFLAAQCTHLHDKEETSPSIDEDFTNQITRMQTKVQRFSSLQKALQAFCELVLTFSSKDARTKAMEQMLKPSDIETFTFCTNPINQLDCGNPQWDRLRASLTKISILAYKDFGIKPPESDGTGYRWRAFKDMLYKISIECVNDVLIVMNNHYGHWLTVVAPIFCFAFAIGQYDLLMVCIHAWFGWDAYDALKQVAAEAAAKAAADGAAKAAADGAAKAAADGAAKAAAEDDEPDVLEKGLEFGENAVPIAHGNMARHVALGEQKKAGTQACKGNTRGKSPAPRTGRGKTPAAPSTGFGGRVVVDDPSRYYVEDMTETTLPKANVELLVTKEANQHRNNKILVELGLKPRPQSGFHFGEARQ